MRIKLLWLIVIIIIIVAIVWSNPPKTQKKKSKSNYTTAVKSSNSKLRVHAGNYTIELSGKTDPNNVESYILKENGTATWMWIQPAGRGGAKVTSEKHGSWDVKENSIVIKIKGNTGTIIETYTYSNGAYRYGSRYLKKIK